MTDDTNLARPGITSPITTSQAFEGSPAKAMLAQPMAVTTTDAAPVASVIPPARPAAGIIQIPGLTNMVQGVRSMMTELRTNGAALQESIGALNSTMKDVTKKVDQTHEDLKFEINSMGN